MKDGTPALSRVPAESGGNWFSYWPSGHERVPAGALFSF